VLPANACNGSDRHRKAAELISLFRSRCHGRGWKVVGIICIILHHLGRTVPVASCIWRSELASMSLLLPLLPPLPPLLVERCRRLRKHSAPRSRPQLARL
jgi:hypothetical protein